MDEWVLNTEAHPLPIKGKNVFYRSADVHPMPVEKVIKAKKNDILAASADAQVLDWISLKKICDTKEFSFKNNYKYVAIIIIIC